MKSLLGLVTGNPIFSAASLLVLIALTLSSYFYGRSDGRALEKSVWLQAQSQQLTDTLNENTILKAEADALRKANKEKEIKHSEDTNKIDVKLQELQDENKMEKNKLIIALRDASKLRQQANISNQAKCGNSTTSPAEPSASFINGEEGIELRPAIAESVVELMYESDDNTDQLTLLQEYTSKLYSFCSTQ